MKLATAAVALLVVCTVSTVAAGAAVVKDPSAMILRQADIPGATYEAEAGLRALRKPLKAAGLSGKAAQYLGVTYSQRERDR